MLYSLLEGISTDSLNEISFCANDSDRSQLKTAKRPRFEALSKDFRRLPLSWCSCHDIVV